MGIKFQTDQTGANQNVCSGTSQTFNFSLAQNYTLDTADFVIKKSSGTTQSISATIYDQKNGVGNVVATVIVLAADITQSFTTIVFTFNTNLTADISYSIVVSSSTSCVGNAPYSIKTGNFQVLDSATNNIINTGYGIAAAITNISTITSAAQLSASAQCSLSSAFSANSSAYRQHNILSNIVCENTNTFSAIADMQAISSSSSNTIIQAQATKTSPDSSIHIRLDGKGNNRPLKIYLGTKLPPMYHGRRRIN